MGLVIRISSASRTLLPSCSCSGWRLRSMLCSAAVTVDRNPVVAGQPFRITFEFKDARVDFQSPPAMDGIRLLNGPSTSTSTQIVNGSMSSTRSYTYTAVAAKPRADPGSQFVFSLPGRNPANASHRLACGETGAAGTAAKPQFSAAIEVDKRKVHLGEPIRVQYRIYNRLDGVDVRSYTFPGPHRSVEGNGGWRRPEVGKHRSERPAVSKWPPFGPTSSTPPEPENWCWKGSTWTPRRAFPFSTPAPRGFRSGRPVEVLPFLPDSPGAPSLGSFNGLSLRWTAEGQNPRKANKAVNLKLEFNGEGNLALLGAPDIAWPADLEVFDPDIQDRIRTTVEGQRGKRTFTFLVIPRAEGVFEIELPRLAYFDFAQDRFQTSLHPVSNWSWKAMRKKTVPALDSTANPTSPS